MLSIGIEVVLGLAEDGTFRLCIRSRVGGGPPPSVQKGSGRGNEELELEDLEAETSSVQTVSSCYYASVGVAIDAKEQVTLLGVDDLLSRVLEGEVGQHCDRRCSSEYHDVSWIQSEGLGDDQLAICREGHE